MNDEFEDFTELQYRELLRLAGSKYEFVRYRSLPREGKGIFWRHDIDLSAHRALALAKIEREEGVVATYFFQLGSSFYNVFETEIKGLVGEILALGHEIGLHFDPARYKVSSRDELKQWLRFEKEILEDLFRCSLPAFSFHNPTAEVLQNDELIYCGMYNTYARYFKESVAYCSDSNGYWRFDSLRDVLSASESELLQVLTHPGWWQEKSMSPRERVGRCIDGRARAQHIEYDKALEKFGRKNVR